mmetsp:Transcript_93268/g.216778  ORF Transcript_93268/g.216778 Transcript_93268/m.216778 type:complete len:229 (-) Transcript_93268:1331-2017(-)
MSGIISVCQVRTQIRPCQRLRQRPLRRPLHPTLRLLPCLEARAYAARPRLGMVDSASSRGPALSAARTSVAATRTSRLGGVLEAVEASVVQIRAHPSSTPSLRMALGPLRSMGPQRRARFLIGPSRMPSSATASPTAIAGAVLIRSASLSRSRWRACNKWALSSSSCSGRMQATSWASCLRIILRATVKFDWSHSCKTTTQTPGWPRHPFKQIPGSTYRSTLQQHPKE